MESLQSIIERLRLKPLAREGGWFRQYYLDPKRDSSGRSRSSVIHFLLTPESDGFSALHALKSIETWKFHSGAPVEMLLLAPGASRLVMLGMDTAGGQHREVTVPVGMWQGGRTLGAWSLVDCEMVPAWDENEFDLGERESLRRAFPGWDRQIEILTR